MSLTTHFHFIHHHCCVLNLGSIPDCDLPKGSILYCHSSSLNTLRPRQNGCHFADIFKCIFLNENVLIAIKISLKFVPKGPINNIPALVQIMAWRRPGNKPLSEPMMVNSPTHICVTRPQRVNDGPETRHWGMIAMSVDFFTRLYWKTVKQSRDAPGMSSECCVICGIQIQLMTELCVRLISG